jgi:hypothetical protein
MFTSRIPLAVAGCAAVYLLSFWLNDLLFSQSTFSKGVDWVFIPSGVRLACVLIFLHWGAVGVALATMGIAIHGDPGSPWAAALVTGAISGFAPWVAHWLYMRRSGLHADLALLSPKSLLTMAVLFSLFTALLHQAWYWWRGQTTDFLSSAAVMALGDFTGCLIVLYALKWGVAGWLHLRVPNS